MTVDTNIIVRFIIRDDEKQARLAFDLLREAELIVIPISCLCEFVWVLHRVYRFSPGDISAAVTTLLRVSNVAADRPAVEAGLDHLNAGGDFADGAIAYEGRWLGGEVFISFHKKAVSLLMKQGQMALLLT